MASHITYQAMRRPVFPPSTGQAETLKVCKGQGIGTGLYLGRGAFPFDAAHPLDRHVPQRELAGVPEQPRSAHFTRSGADQPGFTWPHIVRKNAEPANFILIMHYSELR
jgi:hypothetical protein